MNKRIKVQKKAACSVTRFGEIPPLTNIEKYLVIYLRFMWFWAKFSALFGTFFILWGKFSLLKMAKY